MAGSGFVYDTRRKLQAIAAKIMPLSLMSKVYTKILCGYVPNLNNPQTFNEKVQWLKLNYYANNQEIANMADKVTVRYKVEKLGLGHLLTKMYFSCDRIEDIPWEILPNKFVLKCNHGCAYNIICSDKSSLSIRDAQNRLKKWLNEDFGLFNIEPHYSNIKRKIFAEEYLGDCLTDYKFFCFNGEPKFLYVSRDLAHDAEAQISYFDMNMEKIPLLRDDYRELENAEKPACFDKLVEYSRMLARDIPFVRVDFYVIGGLPVFSEMTFTPSAGMMPISPRSYDVSWGDLLDISRLVK